MKGRYRRMGRRQSATRGRALSTARREKSGRKVREVAVTGESKVLCD
jgi:hypothetical protein